MPLPFKSMFKISFELQPQAAETPEKSAQLAK